MRSFVFFMVFVFSFSCLTVFAFEIPYPDEKGFFIGVELLYQTINSKQEKQEGIFVFGQKRVWLENREYFDCILSTPTNDYHFYFTLNSEKQSLLFKGLEMGTSTISTSQPVISVFYPLNSGKKWSEGGIEIVGKNIEIPDLGALPELTVENVMAKSFVSSDSIIVPAGKFETLRVETNFSGNILNIPISIVQRTWLDDRNIIIKMCFEINFFSKIIPIFDMELIDFIPSGLLPCFFKTSLWAFLKTE